jgi:hypothetical protein
MQFVMGKSFGEQVRQLIFCLHIWSNYFFFTQFYHKQSVNLLLYALHNYGILGL